MQLSNLTKVHLQLFAALTVGVAMALAALITPAVLIFKNQHSIFWLIPAWVIGQGVVMFWMSRVVDPLSKALPAAEKNPFLRRYDLRVPVVLAGVAAIAYGSYHMGYRDGREAMSEIVQQNCGTSLTCHAKYTFDYERVRRSNAKRNGD
ncbi:MAG: hypothetical protein DI537_10355 [Stutzerimonas stutzeri]|nr:MAG: hypothetical protein DI537_10355 [Stutzerimonas stutzeri]